MYLAEDRVRIHSSLSMLYRLTLLIDLVLGVGVETWRFMAPALCQICICSYRCTGSGTLNSKESLATFAHYTSQVPELISQRRRWLNGSFFAAVHSVFHFHYLYRSSHTFIRKAWIHVELIYQVYNLIFSWFSLGNYYIAFTILTQSMEGFGIKGIHVLNVILEYFYLGLLVMCFLLSLGNRPQGSKWGYTLAFIGFGLITIYMTVRLPLLFRTV
jgi:chitin synthase